MALPELVMVVHTQIPSEREDEFNHWYDEIHLPEITNCPGFIRSARYVSEQDDHRRYLALYELENESALHSEEFKKHRGVGQFRDDIEISVGIYRRRIALENAERIEP